MIPFFPDPYPDEIFNSIVARYKKRMNISSNFYILQELFDEKYSMPSIDLTKNIKCLIEQLPLCHNYTAELFIENHTLFPLYRPFLSQVFAIRLHEFIKSNPSPLGQRIRLGLDKAERILTPFYRYCPTCSTADLSKFGELYWHRLHQIAGVNICPIHDSYLIETHYRTLNSYNIFPYFESSLIQNNTNIKLADTTNICEAKLLEISKSVDWLLNYSNKKIYAEQTYLKYNYILRYIKFEDFNLKEGILPNALTLWMRFSEFLLPNNINSINENYKIIHFLYFFHSIYKSTIFCNPLMHILFIHFLGYTTESFFNLLLKEQNLENV